MLDVAEFCKFHSYVQIPHMIKLGKLAKLTLHSVCFHCAISNGGVYHHRHLHRPLKDTPTLGHMRLPIGFQP